MVLIRRIHHRGVDIVVEAHGEVLFAPTGPFGNWTRRFSNRITAFARQEAPANKRPRWAHYGKPLKSTMTSSTTYQPGRFKVYAAVGSKAPYAAYVDQGTGIYGGGGAYPAKILPPWVPGSASLYENTWRPNGPGHRKVGQVMISGQRGQFFFAKALSRAFASMRMRAFQVPGDPQIAKAVSTAPASLTNLLGGSTGGAAFQAQLEEWRSWRDEAWKRGDGLGRGGGVGSRSHARYVQTIREAQEARLADQGKGRAAYLASRAAAEKRKRDQLAAIRKQKEDRAKAALKREEQEAKDLAAQKAQQATRALAAGNAQERRMAVEFFRLIKTQDPNAKFSETKLADGVILYSVRYTSPGGEVKTERWAYGYDV